MAKEYEVTPTLRVVNGLMKWLSRRGWGPSVELTTVGRRSGEDRSVPVSPIDVEGATFLVAPYGNVAWVLNARANPTARLRRGENVTEVRLTDVTGERPEVVAAYHERESFARSYMDVPESPEVADFAAKGAEFPVFRVDPA